MSDLWGGLPWWEYYVPDDYTNVTGQDPQFPPYVPPESQQDRWFPYSPLMPPTPDYTQGFNLWGQQGPGQPGLDFGADQYGMAGLGASEDERRWNWVRKLFRVGKDWLKDQKLLGVFPVGWLMQGMGKLVRNSTGSIGATDPNPFLRPAQVPEWIRQFGAGSPEIDQIAAMLGVTADDLLSGELAWAPSLPGYQQGASPLHASYVDWQPDNPMDQPTQYVTYPSYGGDPVRSTTWADAPSLQEFIDQLARMAAETGDGTDPANPNAPSGDRPEGLPGWRGEFGGPGGGPNRRDAGINEGQSMWMFPWY